MIIFIKNEGLVELRKNIFFCMVIFQNGFSPKAASRQSRIFGDPENPENPSGRNPKNPSGRNPESQKSKKI